MPDLNWRSAEAYDYLSALTPEGLAWEFLRRNADYRTEYDRLQEEVASGIATEAALADFARRWGLRFRG